MADTQYKKGELLLDETITIEAGGSYNFGILQTQRVLTEETVIVIFNDVEYICEATHMGEDSIVYGEFNNGAPSFTNYPFNIGNNEVSPTQIVVFTENPGTHTIKIYTAVEDTDSTPLSSTDFIIAYLMKSPQNSNWNVLSTLLGDGDWSKLKAYVETTPKNMNRQILRVLLGGGSSGSSAVVGTAVVGEATVD